MSRWGRILWKGGHCHCAYCGRKLQFGWMQCLDTFTVDHKRALSRGGKDTLSNITVACEPCNIKKANGYMELAYDTKTGEHK